MAEDAGKDEPSALDAFAERLKRQRGEEAGASEPEGRGRAWGPAMRASSELLAAVIVGTLLGLGLDRWLGTSPWFLIAGLGFGFAAGLRNVWRTLKG